MNKEEIKNFIEENYYIRRITIEESKEKYLIEIDFITAGLTIYVSVVKYYVVGNVTKKMFFERLKNDINFEISEKFKRF